MTSQSCESVTRLRGVRGKRVEFKKFAFVLRKLSTRLNAPACPFLGGEGSLCTSVVSLSVFKMTPSIDFRLLCQAGAEVEGVARWVEVVRCPPDRAKRLLRVSAALCPLKASPHLQPIYSLRTF